MRDVFSTRRPDPIHYPRVQAVRAIVVLVMVVGYASTMPLGPEAVEMGTVFGIQPSWVAIQLLFLVSGFLAMRSLDRHGSGLRMLCSRAMRNLPLLALVTAVVAGLVYPVLRVETGMSPRELMAYFAMTVSCADPGGVMPGALDDAHYACLLQGAVWTFRWGAVAYLGLASVNALGVLRDDRVVLLGAVAATLAFAVTDYTAAKTGDPVLATAATGLRLLYPFAVGMALWRYRRLVLAAGDSRLAAASLAIVALAAAVAALNHTLMPWTPLIGIGLFAAAGTVTMRALLGRGPAWSWLDDWPPLALPMFLLNWPVAQVWLHFVPQITPAQLVGVTIATVLAVALALRADMHGHGMRRATA